MKWPKGPKGGMVESLPSKAAGENLTLLHTNSLAASPLASNPVS